MKLADVRIGSRLAAAFAVVFVLLLVILGVGIRVIDGVNATMGRVVEDRYALIALTTQVKSVGDRGAITIGRLLLAGTPDAAKKYMDEYAVIRQTNSENLAKLEKMLADDEQAGSSPSSRRRARTTARWCARSSTCWPRATATARWRSIRIRWWGRRRATTR